MVEVIWQSLLPSPPNRDKAWFTGAFPSKLNIRWPFSKLLRSKPLFSTGLIFPLFSCPLKIFVGTGAALPASGAGFSARFIGLFGDVLVLEDCRGGAVFDRVEDRRANFALGGKGTASGDGV